MSAIYQDRQAVYFGAQRKEMLPFIDQAALKARQDCHVTGAALMRADLWTCLSENCLTKTDRASMAHGLEIRVHLADGLKTLLTELDRQQLPATVWNRPKHGFSVPVSKLLRTSWKALADNVFSRVESIAPWLDADEVRRLWMQAQAGRGGQRLLYTFLVLLVWLEGNPLGEPNV